MNLRQSARYHRRRLVRRVHLAHARLATWTRERFPDFLGIGAPRAATTWLHRELSKHPDVFLPKRKEIHFYDEPRDDELPDRGDLRWRESFYFDVRNPAHLRWYWYQFRNAGGRLAGDITPLYSTLSRERVHVIREHMPDARVMYILRNPVERAWSGLRKSVWYQKGSDYLDAQSTDWAFAQVMHPDVLMRGNYPRAIENWESAFPRTQILYLFHDDVEASPASSLDCVHAFLGLSTPATATAGGQGQRINAAPARSMPEPIRRALNEHYAGQIRWLESRFERDLSHWLQ